MSCFCSVENILSAVKSLNVVRQLKLSFLGAKLKVETLYQMALQISNHNIFHYRRCVTVKQFEKFSLKFSMLLFVIRVNLLHP